MITTLWIAVYLFVYYAAARITETNPWIQIEGCYNITTYHGNFSMTSPARPSECFSLCNSDSVALQGNICYCDPYYSDNTNTIQNFLHDAYCANACQESPKVFCGGSQSAMSVYRKDTSVSLLPGINPSQHGCVYVHMNDTTVMKGYVDQFCNQTHGALCFEHCSYTCFKSAANLTWAEALRYCSNCSGDVMSILAPKARALSCTRDSFTSHRQPRSYQCSPPTAGTFSLWIGLYKDKVKVLNSSVSPQINDASSVLIALDNSVANSPTTKSSGTKTNVDVVIGGCVSGIAVVGVAVVIFLYQRYRSRNRITPAWDLEHSIN